MTDQERLSQTALILFREAEALTTLRLKGKTDANDVANQILSIATQIAARAASFAPGRWDKRANDVEDLRGN